MKTSELRCINEVETKNQRMTKCGSYLGTVVHKNRVVITCRTKGCKQQYAIVGENLEIKKLIDADVRFAEKVEV